MIHTTVTPVNSKVSLEIPQEYIGKKVEVLLYTLEEAEEKKLSKPQKINLPIMQALYRPKLRMSS